MVDTLLVQVQEMILILILVYLQYLKQVYILYHFSFILLEILVLDGLMQVHLVK